MSETFNKEKDVLNIEDTLKSGQAFRYTALKDGSYFVISGREACIVKSEADKLSFTATNARYFENYFSFSEDFVSLSKASNYPLVTDAVEFSKGIKILKQDRFEALITFIISANNNIKRIAKTVNGICESYGEKLQFEGISYYSFPTPQMLLSASEEDYKKLGAGYRAGYLCETVKRVADGYDLSKITSLDTYTANKELCSFKGVGEKVADCILLFAYQKYDAFPVDTWIEKVYRDEFNGKETNRRKIREYFVGEFGEYAGVIQQYLFHYKRNKIQGE